MLDSYDEKEAFILRGSRFSYEGYCYAGIFQCTILLTWRKLTQRFFSPYNKRIMTFASLPELLLLFGRLKRLTNSQKIHESYLFVFVKIYNLHIRGCWGRGCPAL